MTKASKPICRYCECDIELRGTSWVDTEVGLPFCRKLTADEMQDADAPRPVHQPFPTETTPA